MNHSFFSDNTKDARVRFEWDDYKYLRNKAPSERTFNKCLATFIRIMREIEGEALNELRGYFKPNEWKFMAEALKDCRELQCSKNELQRQVMLIQNMEARAQFYQVVPAELTEKIATLSSVHVLCIYQRVNEFWHRSEFVSMDEWAKF